MALRALTLILFFVACKTTSKPIPSAPQVTTTLDGTKSIADYFFWRQISGKSVTINGTTTMKPVVTFKDKGVYEFELMASVKNVKDHPLDTVKITVK